MSAWQRDKTEMLKAQDLGLELESWKKSQLYVV